MEENQIEQQNNLIDIQKEDARKKYEAIFDDKDLILKKIKDIENRIESYQQVGLVIDKENIIKGLEESLGIEDREVFVGKLLKLLEPLIVFQATKSDLTEKAEREFVMKDYDKKGRIRLSEVLYCGLNNDHGIVHIHLAPSRDFMKRDKINDFNEDIHNGFKKLAKMVNENEKIKKVTATSWIVEKSGERLESLGFTLEGEIDKELKKKHFKDEERPVHGAFMSRDDFLTRYLN